MDKEAVAELKEKTLEQFIADYMGGNADTYFPIDRLPTLEVVFEMGANVEKCFLEPTRGESPMPLFEKADLNGKYEDEAIHVVGKEGLIALVNAYRKRVIESYKDKLVPSAMYESESGKAETPEEKMKYFVENRIYYWDNEYVDYLNLDDANPNSLSRFWDYEYIIFTLIHLLKTIDWETKDLVLYGW
jgi:hypothetical protein